VPVAITPEVVSGAPGVTVELDGTDLDPGGSAGVTLGNQGAAGTGTTDIPAVFNGASVDITIPDGASDGPLTITAADSSVATVPLRVNSQYVFSSEYVGEGPDTSGFATGELDAILQRASAYADAYLCKGTAANMTLRLLQVIEQSKYRKRTRRVYPRRRPIVSIDQFTYVASPSLQVNFDVSTFVVAPDLDFIELVIWSMGYTYINALASYTMYDAGLCLLTYTAGYSWAQYPQALREATKMIATELISQRAIQQAGLGGLARTKQLQLQYDRRNEPFAIPDPAKTLLNSLRSNRPA
jgi:hypothetical protein